MKECDTESIFAIWSVQMGQIIRIEPTEEIKDSLISSLYSKQFLWDITMLGLGCSYWEKLEDINYSILIQKPIKRYI